MEQTEKSFQTTKISVEPLVTRIVVFAVTRIVTAIFLKANRKQLQAPNPKTLNQKRPSAFDPKP